MGARRQGGPNGIFSRAGRADEGERCGGGWARHDAGARANVRASVFRGRGLGTRAAAARDSRAFSRAWRSGRLRRRDLQVWRDLPVWRDLQVWRGLQVRRGGPGRGGSEGAGLEIGDQGGELPADAAQLQTDQPDHRQVDEAPDATGAKHPQHHRDDAVEGFGQALGADVSHSN